MSATVRRYAAAPITWGVCEVPGWGHQLDADRVLAEIAALGLRATEAGPDGFLPSDPRAARNLLGKHGLRLAAGFIPVVLHRPELWAEQRESAKERIRTLAAAGAEVAVLAAVTEGDGYESSVELDAAAWRCLAGSLKELEEFAMGADLRLAFHPHYGTVVESPDQIERLLTESDVRLCLDTGHVAVGGGDPVALAGSIPERVGHVHLKDVDMELADRVRAGGLGYREGVAAGMYRPLGEGDVDIAAIVAALDDAGFEGWYVFEQDRVLSAEEEAGDPLSAAARSVRYLESLTRVESSGSGTEQEGGK